MPSHFEAAFKPITEDMVAEVGHLRPGVRRHLEAIEKAEQRRLHARLRPPDRPGAGGLHRLLRARGPPRPRRGNGAAPQAGDGGGAPRGTCEVPLAHGEVSRDVPVTREEWGPPRVVGRPTQRRGTCRARPCARRQLPRACAVTDGALGGDVIVAPTLVMAAGTHPAARHSPRSSAAGPPTRTERLRRPRSPVAAPRRGLATGQPSGAHNGQMRYLARTIVRPVARGRPSARRLAEVTRARAVALIRERVGPTFAHRKLTEEHASHLVRRAAARTRGWVRSLHRRARRGRRPGAAQRSATDAHTFAGSLK